MNRHYTPGDFLNGVNLLRQAFGHPAVTTDVIVGFPGETEDEFEATRQFVETAGFYEMHIFKYSRRKGTKAAVMPMQVPEAEKSRRSSVLQSIERRDSKHYRSHYIGRDVEVLFEEKKKIAGEEYWLGHTREYVKVAFPAQGEDLENQLVTGRITGFLGDEIMVMEY